MKCCLPGSWPEAQRPGLLLGASHVGTPGWQAPEFQTPRRKELLSVTTLFAQFKPREPLLSGDGESLRSKLPDSSEACRARRAF